MEIPQFPTFTLTEKDLVGTPPPIFADLANRVCQICLSDPPDVNRLAQVLHKLAQHCNEGIVKRALIHSQKYPTSLVAVITRMKIESTLPRDLQTRIITDGIIEVGSWAAQIPEIWTAVWTAR